MLERDAAAVMTRLAQSRAVGMTVWDYTLLVERKKSLARDLEYWRYYAQVDESEYRRYEQLVFPQGQVG